VNDVLVSIVASTVAERELRGSGTWFRRLDLARASVIEVFRWVMPEEPTAPAQFRAAVSV